MNTSNNNTENIVISNDDEKDIMYLYINDECNQKDKRNVALFLKHIHDFNMVINFQNN